MSEIISKRIKCIRKESRGKSYGMIGLTSVKLKKYIKKRVLVKVYSISNPRRKPVKVKTSKSKKWNRKQKRHTKRKKR